MLKNEWVIFCTALMFYTRIPVSKNLPYSDQLLSSSRKYFPAIGIFVGITGTIIFWLTNYLLPLSLAVLLSMIATILLTGAFHEDGFADSCDGLGGGWGKQQILTIMKDSRLGTYACIGLVLILSAKFMSLWELAKIDIILFCLSLLFAHTISRFYASLVVDTYEYVQDIDTSKSKPITRSKLDIKAQAISTIIVLFPVTLLLVKQPSSVIALVTSALIAFGFANYCHHRIGGFTGDTLGATQQLSELTIYIILLAISH